LTIRQALAAVLQLFVVFTFFGLGFVLVCLPFAPDARILLSHALLNEPDLCSILGIGFFLAAFLCALGFYALNRGRILVLQMGKHVLAMDETVIRETIEPSLHRAFAEKLSLDHVEIVRQRDLEIGVSLASMGEEEREQLLLSAEQHLETLLLERFGYRRPFKVQISTSSKF